MARKHRPYGKGEIPEERGRDKSARAKARTHRIRQNIEKLIREGEERDARGSRVIHCDLVNSFRL